MRFRVLNDIESNVEGNRRTRLGSNSHSRLFKHAFIFSKSRSWGKTTQRVINNSLRSVYRYIIPYWAFSIIIRFGLLLAHLD